MPKRHRLSPAQTASLIALLVFGLVGYELYCASEAFAAKKWDKVYGTIVKSDMVRHRRVGRRGSNYELTVRYRYQYGGELPESVRSPREACNPAVSVVGRKIRGHALLVGGRLTLPLTRQMRLINTRQRTLNLRRTCRMHTGRRLRRNWQDTMACVSPWTMSLAVSLSVWMILVHLKIL